MDVDQYHMLFSSNDYDLIYELNTNTYFSVDLPISLTLDDSWEVGLSEVWFRSSEGKAEINICADFCVESLVNNEFTPLLRRIQVRGGYNHYIYSSPNYYAVTRQNIKTVSFYIRSVKSKSKSFIRGVVTLQLHFRKRNKKVWI